MEHKNGHCVHVVVVVVVVVVQADTKISALGRRVCAVLAQMSCPFAQSCNTKTKSPKGTFDSPAKVSAKDIGVSTRAGAGANNICPWHGR